MPTAPTLISYTEMSYSNAGASLVSASISWQIGDVVVVIVGTEGPGAETPAVSAITGLPWATQQSNSAGSTCITLLSAAVATNTSSSAITCTKTGSTITHWGFSVWVYRGSDGIGNSVEGHTSAKTISLTPTAADSAIVWAGFDWGANAVTNNNITPTPTNTNERAQDTGANYTIYVADLTDQTSAGATSYGVSGSGTIGAFSKLVLEIKGAAGAALFVPPFKSRPFPYAPGSPNIFGH